jgi:hypothetical protein
MKKSSKGSDLESDTLIIFEAMKDGVINHTMKASEVFLDLSINEKYSRLTTRFSIKQITNCFNRLKKYDSCSGMGGVQQKKVVG